ncbi:MAG: membrane protein insertase YidC, partial [Bacteroidetes bacterium]|nr:membrane protein insertase YidC [Bacteroidota bacterium]
MDKNTVVGLVLIGLILSVFTIFNQPTKEELEKQRQELVETQKAKAAVEDKKTEEVTKTAVKEKVNTTVEKDSTVVPAQTIRLENDKMIVFITNKGGQIERVYLKEYESYYDFSKSDGKITPLLLFDKNDARNSVVFTDNGKTIESKDLTFAVNKNSYDKASLTATLENGKSVNFKYDLSANNFNLGYKITLNGLENAIEKGVHLDWQTSFKKTERLFSEQRRVTTVCYEYEKEGFDYLSETSDDEEELEDKVNWIAFKQSYFSSILSPSKPFTVDDSELKVRNFKEGTKKFNTRLKELKANIGLDFDATNQSAISFDWYFGPNDYEILKAHGENYDEILNFGWGLFRWINIYAVQPVFNFFLEFGISIGLVILLLTIVLKIFLMPVQWKMYVSSAKMRILKPEIDELNAKYPDKADSMKKQMDMMTLYRESGASPLAGCLPALIQMPILLAVFRFFPSAFELRQKSFLWAEDLSSYDSVLELGVYIWPYGDHVSLFTLLMAGTTLIYTHLNSGQMQQPSQPGMPNMKVLMYLMPVMMIFFFNNYSSGLSYYYFVSTLVSILIMVMIKKFFVDEEKLKLKMAARKATSTSKKGGKTK